MLLRRWRCLFGLHAPLTRLKRRFTTFPPRALGVRFLRMLVDRRNSPCEWWSPRRALARRRPYLRCPQMQMIWS